jgi:NAD+ diphosphatase
MTSLGSHERETVLAYSGAIIDRAANQRSDPAWVDATLAADGARLIPMWRDRCIVAGEPPVPVIVPAAEARAVLSAAAEVVFLGLDDHGGIFAADLSPAGEAPAREAPAGEASAGEAPAGEAWAAKVAGGERALDVRSLAGALRPAEAALLGYARGILYWHRHQRYCGTCGSPTRTGHGGHLRTCQNEACTRLHFPRVEPAVIMLVENQGTPRKCLLARHKGSAAGSYSTLAGFVGVSESLEDAVRREVAEETGVPVGTVTYQASQGWPFPSGLMIGFRATALAETVHADGEEVIEARWFTRAELADHAAATGRLGREDSIDRYLLRSWLDEAR